MTLHNVEYSYSLPEYAALDLDLDEALDHVEKEAEAIELISEQFPDAEDIMIESIKVVHA